MNEFFIVPVCDISVYISYETSVSLQHMLITARTNVY